VPDIRIEVPAQIVQELTEKGRLGTPLRHLSVVAARAAHDIMTDGVPNSTLTREDFWTRASIVESSTNVIYVDVTMVKSDDRTPELQKRLADHLRQNLYTCARLNQCENVGVLVWIHMKDKEVEFSEIEPPKAE
jgi:hypothetical protein